MPTLANYVAITDTPIALAAGAVQNFAFNAPALDGASPTILLFRIFPTVNSGLELAINANVVFTVPAFNVDGGRSLHEVIPAGIVVPGANTLTATNIGAANVSFSGITLLFQT
ncbi:MAG: hypothetical protein LC799_05605 [Actinobacteria bacterium]|nr:hypothetical protein [Actinomycetota bacterium]